MSARRGPAQDGPNLVGFQVNHRAMRSDTRRLAELLRAVADGERGYDRRRAVPLGRYLRSLTAGIHHHHQAEDEVLWPVLARRAGAEIDLRELSDDHAALDPLLARVDELTDRFVAEPGDRTAAGRLAAALTRLRDQLDEHIEEEERLLFPVIRRYVPTADWQRVEQAVRKGSAFRFELPRMERHARPEELAELHALAGPALRVMLFLLRPGFRRREARVFG
ncbi:hemerythrin domain-containing protein [Micromonospora sp. NPDC092111]|uniref:hemerythrin domain-containing protein n=1 Tax=Micromonospora sp. NPDC092111 TaxID=3364289 RepID=UPI00382BC782